VGADIFIYTTGSQSQSIEKGCPVKINVYKVFSLDQHVLKYQTGGIPMNKKADFRKYYHDAQATDLLTEREKTLIGIAVAIVRNCQP
jgi:hypothetical protein